MPTALGAAVASFAVMVGVMNLAGYVAVGHGHAHGDVFTVISAHIVGMYGLVLVVGDLVDRIGRAARWRSACRDGRLQRRPGLAHGDRRHVGVALRARPRLEPRVRRATTELVSLAPPSERGRLVGFSDLVSSFAGAALALGGGVIYSAGGSVPLALFATGLAALPPPGCRESAPASAGRPPG